MYKEDYKIWIKQQQKKIYEAIILLRNIDTIWMKEYHYGHNIINDIVESAQSLPNLNDNSWRKEIK